MKRFLFLTIMVFVLLAPTVVMADTPTVNLSTTIPAQISIKITNNDGVGTVPPIIFGSVAVGAQSGWSQQIMITNNGTSAFTASASFGGTFYNDCLILQQWNGTTWAPQIYARNLSSPIPAGSAIIVQLAVSPTSTYSGTSQVGSITFVATL